MHSLITTSLTAVTIAVVSVSVASCTSTETHPATTQTTVAQQTSPPPAPASSSAGSQTEMSNQQGYTVTRSVISGATPDGGGRWNAEVGQLSGGDPRVAEVFNNAADASARQQIERARADADSIPDWTFEVKPELTFRPTAVAQLLTGVYYAKGAAHPTNYVSSVVIDSRTAKPITLTDLFADEREGLVRLSEQTKQIWPTVYGDGEPMADEPGNQPIAENFANWIPTAEGMELHFADYQFGHGLPVITVPWSSLTDVLAPDMAALAQR